MGGRCLLLPLLLLLASRSGSYTGAVSGELGGGRPLWFPVCGTGDCRGACGPGAANPGAMRLRGGGRAWIRKTIKGVRKKEKQRKKRNLDTTNLGQVEPRSSRIGVGG